MSTIAERTILVVNDASRMACLCKIMRRLYPEWPKNCCARFLSQVLHWAKVADMSLFPRAQELADFLEGHGWVRIHVAESPLPGDVFVCKDENDVKGTDHIGLVVRAMPVTDDGDRTFLAADNHIEASNLKPYQRNIGKGERTPVEYWLRPPTPKETSS